MIDTSAVSPTLLLGLVLMSVMTAGLIGIARLITRLFGPGVLGANMRTGPEAAQRSEQIRLSGQRLASTKCVGRLWDFGLKQFVVSVFPGGVLIRYWLLGSDVSIPATRVLSLQIERPAEFGTFLVVNHSSIDVTSPIWLQLPRHGPVARAIEQVSGMTFQEQ